MTLGEKKASFLWIRFYISHIYMEYSLSYECLFLKTKLSISAFLEFQRLQITLV